MFFASLILCIGLFGNFNVTIALSDAFNPIILITADQERYLIIEGHSRMTVYGLDPKKFVGTFGYLGIFSEEEMINYDPRFQ